MKARIIAEQLVTATRLKEGSGHSWFQNCTTVNSDTEDEEFNGFVEA